MELNDNYTINNLVNVFKNIDTHPLKHEVGFNHNPLPFEIITLREFINNMKLFNITDIDHGYLVRAIQYRAKHQGISIYTSYKDTYTIDILIKDIRKTIGYINIKRFLRQLHVLYDNILSKSDKRQKLDTAFHDSTYQTSTELINCLNSINLITRFYYDENATLDDLEKLIYSVHRYDNTGYVGDIDNLYDILDLFIDIEDTENQTNQ